MNSLVGYGTSSESESDGEDGCNGNRSSCLSEGKTASVLKSRNLLLESISASSESGNESEETEAVLSSHTPAAVVPTSLLTRFPLPSPSLSSLTPKKLPPPPLGTSTSSSVFANPFKVQADEKLSALQKHVPLTLQAKPSQIDGKRMCVAYRKDGRCRFGIKCKFAHDSDLQSLIIPSNYEAPAGDTPSSDRVESCKEGQHNFSHGVEQKDPEGQQSRKRRVGLSNTLIPPKRAMKQYSMQKNRERVKRS